MDKRFDIIRSEVLGKIRPTREENQTIHATVSQVSRILDEWNKSYENYPYEFISPQGLLELNKAICGSLMKNS